MDEVRRALNGLALRELKGIEQALADWLGEWYGDFDALTCAVASSVWSGHIDVLNGLGELEGMCNQQATEQENAPTNPQGDTAGARAEMPGEAIGGCSPRFSVLAGGMARRCWKTSPIYMAIHDSCGAPLVSYSATETEDERRCDRCGTRLSGSRPGVMASIHGLHKSWAPVCWSCVASLPVETARIPMESRSYGAYSKLPTSPWSSVTSEYDLVWLRVDRGLGLPKGMEVMPEPPGGPTGETEG
jgi:hypothetical protein